MDEDLFELEYADELDALDEIDVPEDDHDIPKSRRTLQFATPNAKARVDCSINNNDSKTKVNDADDSFSDVNSSVGALNNTIQSEDELDVSLVEEKSVSNKKGNPNNNSINSCKHSQKRSFKKRESETDVLNAEVDDFFASLPDLDEPGAKRPRTGLPVSLVEEDVEGPAPPPPLTDRNRQPGEKASSRLQFPDSHHPTPSSNEDLGQNRVLRTLPAGDFVSTSWDGQRFYMKLCDETDFEKEIDSIGENVRHSANLLQVPISEMRDQLEEERHRQLIQEAQDLTVRVQRLQEESDQGMGDEEILEGIKETDGSTSESLWVDHYAPHRYIELLSEESVNRMLLHWLKQWDYVVFGKDLPAVKDKKQKHNNKDAGHNKWKKFQPEVSSDLDDYKRPVQKVVLLCGPPGLGKTTLAHVVAKHAGYNVVEMNASDDRSVEVFTNKIEAATQMRAVMGADPRPNCLVIDEIDGAPQAAVNVLLNILKRPEGGQGTKKKKREGDMLLRPIICICNDQYAPSLRQLRQQALVLSVPPTESSRLAARLSEVVRQEELKADMNTLMALCERTDNDIRSCLNTLQFIRKKQKELSLRTVQTMSIGQKDSHKSLFSVWKDIFTMPRPKRNRFLSIQDLLEGKADGLQLNAASPTARFQHILSMVQATGEYERIIQGLYENYLEAKSKDRHLLQLNLSVEWLCFVDGINQYTMHKQDYSLMKYVPFLPVAFHMMYASFVPPRINFPHVHFEVQQTTNKITNLLTTMLSDMTPTVREFVTIRSLTLDLLPQLLDVLQPTLRPVNTQLYSAREKADLTHLVHIMINYNMTYRQERSPEGQYTYVLEPNVEEVVRFSGLKQRKQLTYGAKQMIAREIELEKMRRSEAALALSVKPAQAVSLPNHKRQTLQSKPVREEKPRTNFFAGFTRTKRQKQSPAVESESETVSDPPIPEEKNVLDTAIWFHFKEGYSNAVRRNVKMQDLL